MSSKIDSRNILSILFKNLRLILLILILSVVSLYYYISKQDILYASKAQILIKFNEEYRPSDDNSNLNAEEKRGLVRANLNILSSRDTIKEITEIIPLDAIYPELVDKIKSENPNATEEEIFKAGLGKLKGDIETEAYSHPGIIEITVKNKDSKTTLDVLKTYLEVFIYNQTKIFKDPKSNISAEHVDKSLKKLTTLNNKLSRFESRNGITALNQEISILLNKRNLLESYLVTNSSGTKLSGLESTQGSSDLGFATIDEAKAKLEQLLLEEKELLATYKADSYFVKAIKDKVNTQRNIVESSINNLENSLKIVNRKLNKLHRVKTEHNRILDEIKIQEQEYKKNKQRLSNAELNEDFNNRKLTQIVVIEHPYQLTNPVSPNKKLIFMLWIVGTGGLIGICILLREFFNSNSINSDKIISKLNIPLIVVLPKYYGRKKALPDNKMALIHNHILKVQTAPKLISILGIRKNEGAHTVAVNLANYLLRKENEKITIIADKKKIKKIYLKNENIRFIDRELLEEKYDNDRDLRIFINKLKNDYTKIIVASPNFLNRTNYTILESEADLRLLVVRDEKTKLPSIEDLVRQLSYQNIEIDGIILNKKKKYIPSFIYNKI